jgi:hypothetical protein
MTWKLYLNSIPYRPVTTFKRHTIWPYNHITAMSDKDQQSSLWYKWPPTMPTNEVYKDSVKFKLHIALSVCFMPTFYGRYFENSILRVKVMNKLHSSICFLHLTYQNIISVHTVLGLTY